MTKVTELCRRGGWPCIATHNIRVTFYVFAFGALFGLGTIPALAFKGAAHASVPPLAFRAGYGRELLTFMAGHGPVELSCIFIAGGAKLLYETVVLFPGDLPRLDNLRLRGREAVRLVVGCVPLLAVAASSKASSRRPPSRPR